jgi:hypothetical protein
LIDAVTVETLGALIVRVPVAEAPLTVAVKTALVLVATAEVVTVAVPVVAPAATVTVAGGVIAVLPEDNATTSPPVGAGLLKVTVAWLLTPPTTVVGAKVTELKAEGVIVRVA